jgi:hypothetical protein
VAPPVTELKSLKEVERAHKNGAITKHDQKITQKYLINVYNFFIYSFINTLVNTLAITVKLIIMIIK